MNKDLSKCCKAKIVSERMFSEWICEKCRAPENLEQDRKDVEKELFNMVYNWGKLGVVTDENCNAFQDKLKEIRMV